MGESLTWCLVASTSLYIAHPYLVAIVQDQGLSQLLLDDCLSAMRYCLKHRPWFHKAQYRVAVALWRQQSPDAAIGELRQLFSRGRKQFTISLWKIIDDEDPERQVWPIYSACISGIMGRLQCQVCFQRSKWFPDSIASWKASESCCCCCCRRLPDHKDMSMTSCLKTLT